MPNEIQVRIAEIKDIETIAELNTAMAWETEQKQLNPATIRRGIRTVMEDSDYGFYVVAEEDGQVVGCLMITYEWSDWRSSRFWWLQSLYVRPAFRRRGVFKRLHDFVKAQALQPARSLRHPPVRRAIQPRGAGRIPPNRHETDDVPDVRGDAPVHVLIPLNRGEPRPSTCTRMSREMNGTAATHRSLTTAQRVQKDAAAPLRKGPASPQARRHLR